MSGIPVLIIPLPQWKRYPHLPETLCCLSCHISTCSFIQNPQPFPTVCRSHATEMETAIPGCSSPMKQASCMLPRVRRTARWLFHSLSLFYSPLSVIFMSKAATAIHGNCIQHPSQICIFPSDVVVSRMSKHTRSAPESLLKSVIISTACFKSLFITITSSSCSPTASPPFPHATTSHVWRTATPLLLWFSLILISTTVFCCCCYLLCILSEIKLPPISKKSYVCCSSTSYV